jgi:hypothetical protein
MSVLKAVLLSVAATMTLGWSATVASAPAADVPTQIVSTASATGQAVRLSITPCTTAALHITGRFEDGSGFAGGSGFTIVFTNVAESACTLTGTPTLEFHAADGSQIGPRLSGPADSAPTLTLAPSASAHAILLVFDAGNFSCPRRTSSRMLVIPPGNVSGSNVPLAIDICTAPPLENLEVRSVAPGDSES